MPLCAPALTDGIVKRPAAYHLSRTQLARQSDSEGTGRNSTHSHTRYDVVSVQPSAAASLIADVTAWASSVADPLPSILFRVVHRGTQFVTSQRHIEPTLRSVKPGQTVD